MSIQWIDSPELDLQGKRIFCRFDFNVPMTESGEITDDTRIKAALPTLNYLMEKGARIIIASHLGRPKGKPKASLSLEPVAARLQQLLQKDITFAEDCVGDGVRKLVQDLLPGSILVLENLRFNSGEERNDEGFSKMLSLGYEVYMNDAFGAAHRAHASTEGTTRFIPVRLGGFLMRKEIDALTAICKHPKKPFVAILGGAKVSDKIGVLSSLLQKVDKLIIGGAMAYTFLKAKGQNIGTSRFEEDRLLTAQSILKKAAQTGIEILLPVDHVVVENFNSDSPTHIVTGEILDDTMGVDIGPKTQKLFAEAIPEEGTVFWNGPMGVTEWDACFAGTRAIAERIAHTQTFSVVGGGDSLMALQKTGLSEHISHVSTGGGASLEFIEGAQLPGLVALGYEF